MPSTKQLAVLAVICVALIYSGLLGTISSKVPSL